MSHTESAEHPDTGSDRQWGRPLSRAAAVSAVILGAWSLWLAASPSWKSATAWMLAAEPDAPPAELFLSDDDDTLRPASDSTADDDQIHRAIHVTMTSVTEEKDAIQPVDFKVHHRSRETNIPQPESPSGVWLTGSIEDGDDAPGLQDPALSAIPAWKRRSQPLKATSAAPRTATNPDR